MYIYNIIYQFINNEFLYKVRLNLYYINFHYMGNMQLTTPI